MPGHRHFFADCPDPRQKRFNLDEDKNLFAHHCTNCGSKKHDMDSCLWGGWNGMEEKDARHVESDDDMWKSECDSDDGRKYWVHKATSHIVYKDPRVESSSSEDDGA